VTVGETATFGVRKHTATRSKLQRESVIVATPWGEVRAKRGWSGTAALPGGDFPVTGFDKYRDDLIADFPFLTKEHARRLVRAYGTKAREILAGAKTLADLGHVFGDTLTEAEVKYLMREEWAVSAEDVLWRRSKLGLRFSREQVGDLETFMNQQAIVARGSAA